METILITGAGPRGVTGRLIKEFFSSKYHLLTPSSSELDLTNDEDVNVFFKQNEIDYIIHCATFRQTSVHNGHFVDEELESNLRMYFSLAKQTPKVKKMLYFGSGAEFDKSHSIVNVSEESFGSSVPKNKYGLGKYIMNKDAINSKNIYNMRLFGTINKYERFTKNIISNLCVKAMLGLPLHLKQDCRFSFIDINDVLPILEKALTTDLNYHDFNLAMDESYLLSDIAKIVAKIAGRKDCVSFANTGLNLEYTASNCRMKNSFNAKLTPLEDSIKRVYDYYFSIKDSIDATEIDSRWK